MPVDNPSKAPTNKPITPALSSRFRNANTPLAPKLAGSSQISPTSIVRKDLRERTLSPQTEQNKAQSLNGNVTPRSGARNARISTDSPASPATTRRLSGSGSVLSTISSSQKGPSITSPRNYTPSQTRSNIQMGSPKPYTIRRTSSLSNVSKKDEGTPKFVRANDAKSVSSYQSPKSTLSPRPLSTSLTASSSPRPARSAPTSNLSTQNEARGKSFVRADDAKARVGQSPIIARKQSTASLNVPNTRSPQLSRLGKNAQSRPQSRPHSTNQTSPGKIMTAIADKAASPQKQSTSEKAPSLETPTSPSERRKSFGSNILNSLPERPILHRKSASVSSFDPLFPKFTNPAAITLGKRMESAWLSPTVTIPMLHNSIAASTPDTLSPRSASLASSKTIGTSVTSDTDASEVSRTGLPFKVTSPTDSLAASRQPQQAQPTPLAQAQMDAANARRERKVLDLEISNSSLLAINKTLEKELRKQSAELRRFRRLSRSGRLSIAPSNRSVSVQSAISLDTLQEQSENEDSYSEEEEEESDLEEMEDDVDRPLEASPGGSTTLSRRRARDERRLMLDLSKHQQLLMDSQRLSQSIRKCLNMSESLIKEANQALNYKVGIGDVKLGGRVLSADEMDVDSDMDDHPKNYNIPRQGLLSPSIATANLQEATLWLNHFQTPAGLSDLRQPNPLEPD